MRIRFLGRFCAENNSPRLGKRPGKRCDICLCLGAGENYTFSFNTCQAPSVGPEIKSFPVFHEASDALIHFLDGLNEGSHCPACTPSQHSQPGEGLFSL